MSGFLLYAYLIIAVLRDGASTASRNLMLHAFGEIYVSSVALFELYCGAFKSALQKNYNIRRVDGLRFQIPDFDATDAGMQVRSGHCWLYPAA
jgi:predicted nucleic acid-binding protein